MNRLELANRRTPSRSLRLADADGRLCSPLPVDEQTGSVPFGGGALPADATNNSPTVRPLKTKKLDPDMPVSIHLRGLPLRIVLALMLGDLRLDYVIKEEVLQIKTKDDVLREPVTLVYVLESHSQRSDDLAALLQKVLDAKHSDPMPPPIVHLVRDSNPEIKS